MRGSPTALTRRKLAWGKEHDNGACSDFLHRVEREKGRRSGGRLGRTTQRTIGGVPMMHTLEQVGGGGEAETHIRQRQAVVERATHVSRGAARVWRGPGIEKWPRGPTQSNVATFDLILKNSTNKICSIKRGTS
jgi:hypothetical protein